MEEEEYNTKVYDIYKSERIEIENNDTYSRNSEIETTKDTELLANYLKTLRRHSYQLSGMNKNVLTDDEIDNMQENVEGIENCIERIVIMLWNSRE